MKDLERQKESTKQKIEQIISPSGALQENAYKTLIELLAEAVEEGNKLVEGFCHAQLARYYYSMSDLEKSGKHLRKGLPLQQIRINVQASKACEPVILHHLLQHK